MGSVIFSLSGELDNSVKSSHLRALGLAPGVRAPLPAALEPFSYIEVDMIPVVAMLMGRGLRGWAGAARIRTPEVGVAGPASVLMALGER